MPPQWHEADSHDCLDLSGGIWSNACLVHAASLINSPGCLRHSIILRQQRCCCWWGTSSSALPVCATAAAAHEPKCNRELPLKTSSVCLNVHDSCTMSEMQLAVSASRYGASSFAKYLKWWAVKASGCCMAVQLFASLWSCEHSSSGARLSNAPCRAALHEHCLPLLLPPGALGTAS